MSIETHIDSALTRVERERAHVEEECRAYKRFHAGVRSLSPQPAPEAAANLSATGGCLSVSGRSQNESTATDACRIRELFAETVRPYSVADLDTEESLLETIREELGDSIAFVLTPGTDTDVTPQIQSAICSTTHQRQQELDAMGSALDREQESLQAAADDCQTITGWVEDTNQTSLREFGFPELQRRHEQLSTHRKQCDERLLSRQETIQRTTSRHIRIGIEHRSLVIYLYQKFPISYPVLSAFTRLDMLLADCQRTVRDHLTRRV